MRWMSKLTVVMATAGFTLSGVALANSAQNAENLQGGIMRAKEVIDTAISSSGASQPGGQPGGFPPAEQPGGIPGGGWPGGQPGGVPGGDWPGGQPGGQPGGGVPGGSPWFVSEDALGDMLESDLLGLPILIQASSSLAQAGSFADNAKLAFNNNSIQLANFKFAQACNAMGLARSQIARANTAALTPPVGFLAAFGQTLTATVIELNNLKASEGCP